MRSAPRWAARVAAMACIASSTGCLLPVSVSDAHQGTVRDVASGVGIAGARVVHEVFRVEPPTDVAGPRQTRTEVTSDGDGNYEVDSDRQWLFVWPTEAGWPQFTARLTISAPGYHPLVLRMQGERLPGEAWLERESRNR